MPNSLLFDEALTQGEDRKPGGSLSTFQLAAVYAVNPGNSAVTLILDGTGTPTQKYYKALTGAWPLQTGDRVIALKMAGTYVVVGKIGAQPSDPTPSFIAAPNTVFAGPTTGESSGEATFRALTADDIPGGGEEETVIVTTDILTPDTNVTIVTQEIAICGKYAELHFSYKLGSNQLYDWDTKVVATLAEGYRPAVSRNVVSHSFNANGQNSGQTSVLAKVESDGNITHCGKATYNYTFECFASYLLP